MILERLSEAAREELEALTEQELIVLAYEMAGALPPGLPPDLDPVVREFLETVQKRPLVDPSADPVALVRGGRRD